MTAHSIVAPSSAARRIQCPASTMLEAQFPEIEETEEQREGIAAHWAAAEQVQGRLVDVGVIAPNGVAIDEDMLRGADLLANDVAAVRFGGEPAVEQRVMIPRVHEQSFGTPDVFMWTPSLALFVWDFKYGHRIVEVFENPQMVEYAAGICRDFNDAITNVNITFTIVQPRAFHRDGPVRRWNTTLLDLRALINISANAAAEALGPDPRARVGPECRDCRARHACPTLQRAVFSELDAAERPLPLLLSETALGVELRLVRRAIDLLEAREAGLREQAMQALRAGRHVPGWHLEHGNGRERWARPAAEIIALGQALGLDLQKPVEAITPRQAREAGLDPEIVKLLAERPRADATLVEDDDASVRMVFG